MITALATLLVSQLAGEALVRLASLPISGPVVGMILLFVVMLTRTRLPPALGENADGLLRHLSLLFVPAGTGVIQHLDRFRQSAVLTTANVGTDRLEGPITFSPIFKLPRQKRFSR